MNPQQAQLDLGCGEIAAPAVMMVDPLFVLESRDAAAHAVGARNGHKWCHLWTEPGREGALHIFAARLGMKRAWFQDKPGFPHYDLTPRKRATAIANGAVERDLAEWIRERRANAS